MKLHIIMHEAIEAPAAIATWATPCAGKKTGAFNRDQNQLFTEEEKS